jgi:hypothetical protein
LSRLENIHPSRAGTHRHIAALETMPALAGLARQRVNVRVPMRRARRSRHASPRAAATTHGACASADVLENHRDGARSRRALLASTLVAVGASAVVEPEAARAEATLTTYEDEKLKFKVRYPSDWTTSTGSTPASEEILGGGARDVFTISPSGANVRDVNVTIVATPAGADFTKMGSLGDAYGFGYGLVVPLNKPRAKKGQEDRIQFAELVDSVGKGDYYKVEYKFAKPSTGINSIFFVLAGLGYDGRVSHLYTTTAQYPRAEEDKWRAQVEAIVDSVVYPPTLYG